MAASCLSASASQQLMFTLEWKSPPVAIGIMTLVHQEQMRRSGDFIINKKSDFATGGRCPFLISNRQSMLASFKHDHSHSLSL